MASTTAKFLLLAAELLSLVAAGAAYAALDSRQVAEWRFAGVAFAPVMNTDIRDLEEILTFGETSPDLLLKGLPHPHNASKKFVHELWEKPNLSIHGFRFHEQPLTMTPEFRDAASAVLSDPASYETYRGPYLCGGFHADFALCFPTTGDPVWMLVCFGCGEVLCFKGNTNLNVMLNHDALKRLSDAWREQLRASKTEKSHAAEAR